MNIQDILRFFSGAADGQRMTDQPAIDTVVQTPMSQAMGAGPGRGFVNPIQAPSSRPKQIPKDEQGLESLISRIMANNTNQEPQVPPLPVTEIPSLPPVSAAMAQESGAPSPASMAPDNRDIGGGQNFAMQGPATQSPGILDKIAGADWTGKDGILSRLSDGLIAAGTVGGTETAQDMRLKRGVAEAKIRSANQPKVDPIAGTPFFQVTYPDGRMETVNNPALAKFYQEQSASKAQRKEDDMRLQARLNVEAAEGKSGIKAADEARPQLAQVRETINTMQRALEVTNQQGTWDQVQAAPLISGVAEFFGTPGAAGNKVLQQLKVDDALRNTAQTKGAISNQEMDLFLSPAPSPTADRQAIWKPWIENKISVFKRLEKTLESEVARAPSAGGSATPAPAAASGGIRFPANPDKLPEISSAADLSKYKGQYIMTPAGRKWNP